MKQDIFNSQKDTADEQDKKLYPYTKRPYITDDDEEEYDDWDDDDDY